MGSLSHSVLMPRKDAWPALVYAMWADTCTTLQLWMQIVGKIRLALTPPLNHTWNVTLYPTVRGLTTMPMPCSGKMLQIDFDFVAHRLQLHTVAFETGRGDGRTIALEPMSVAAFYRQVMTALEELGTPVKIWTHPVEVAEPVPFDLDTNHHAYDPEYAQRYWLVLLQTTRVFEIFRARFIGKVSPIHLFWGALDLACTCFSGRPAPEHPSMPGLADRVTRDAYSHEVSSCGFWPGAPGLDAMFYSYAYPEPAGYAQSSIAPALGGFDATMGEFVLPYEEVRQAADPDATLLAFLQRTYEAAADCGHWDRAALEAER